MVLIAARHAAAEPGAQDSVDEADRRGITQDIACAQQASQGDRLAEAPDAIVPAHRDIDRGAQAFAHRLISNSSPDPGFSASARGLSLIREVVTNNVSGVMKQRLLTCGAGTLISRRTAPSLASCTTQLPPHIATQKVPSDPTVMPSGLPGMPRKSLMMTGSPSWAPRAGYASSVRISVSTTYSLDP